MIEYPKSVYEAVSIVAEELFSILGTYPSKDSILQLQSEYEQAYIDAGYPRGDTKEGLIEYILDTKFVVKEENDDQ
jgi:hypothetical protein